jgi:hypothetical protein
MLHRERRLALGTTAATLVAAGLAASPAQAAWGPVLTPAASGGAQRVTVAVDGRGDVAAAWVQEYGRTVTVRAAVAANGRPATVRTLLRARDRAVRGLTTTLDGRGELTVAWVDQAVTRGLLHGPITLRAAYRVPSGRWSGVRAVSRLSPFAYAEPRLAAAPDGTVALTFNAGVRAAPGVGAAWRTSGRPFGRVASVPTGRHRYLLEPALAFDASGRAHLAGTAPDSRGVLFTATTRARRFAGPRTIAPAPASHVRYVLAGPGRALTAWVAAGASTTEDLSGAIRTARVTDEAVGPPVAVNALPSTGLTLSGAPSGGGELAFTQFGPGFPAGEAVVARIGPDGAVSAAGAPADGWAAVTADRAGDQLVAPARPALSGPPGVIAARPAIGGTVETAPLGGPAYFATASAPDGAALAAARPTRRALRVAVWRPPATPLSR